jgi:hypothetical protein
MSVIEELHGGCLGLQGLSKHRHFKEEWSLATELRNGLCPHVGFETSTGLNVDDLPLVELISVVVSVVFSN